MLFRLREAEEGDAAPVAEFFRRVRQATMPYLPDLHTPEEDHRYFAKKVIGQVEVRIAEVDGVFVGFSAYRPGWLDHLYVDPDWHGRRIGTALLRDAMAANTALQLWTFQKNEQARGFYERHGFREVERTDGSRNEEREPDMRYEWRRG